MTGEVTLQGRVLPIGGLKQKVLAAHAAGLTEVIVPDRNAADLDDVPPDVRDADDVPRGRVGGGGADAGTRTGDAGRGGIERRGIACRISGIRGQTTVGDPREDSRDAATPATTADSSSTRPERRLPPWRCAGAGRCRAGGLSDRRPDDRVRPAGPGSDRHQRQGLHDGHRAPRAEAFAVFGGRFTAVGRPATSRAWPARAPRPSMPKA